MIKVSALNAAVAHERARSWSKLASDVAQSGINGKRTENEAFLEGNRKGKSRSTSGYDNAASLPAV